MDINDLAKELASTVTKQHPAHRDMRNWTPYRGPRGGEGYLNTHTGDVVYGDNKPGRSWDSDGEIDVDESFEAAPDGYQWERPPMNFDVRDEIQEAEPENIDGFLEARFSGDQVIYEDGEGEEAPHSWGRVEGARVDTYTNLGGHETTGVILELESDKEVPLSGVRKHVNTSQDPKYENWQLAGENPHENDLEDVSEKVYHSFAHDQFEWKEYADWRNEAESLPVLSERGADDLWSAMSAYFDNEAMNELREDMASWKSDSDRGTGRYSDIAKEVLEIDAVSREGRNGRDWDSSNEEDFKRAVEVLADVSRRFYKDQYEEDSLFRGVSRHGFRSLVKGWLENPGADEFEIEHRALANYSADHRVARDWAGNTVVIQPNVDPNDIVLAIDGLNFSGVHNTESEVHMRGDRMSLKPDNVKLKTREDTQGQTPWPDRKAGLSESISNWHKDDAENFSRAISLIYAEETPDEEAARRFLNIAKVHEANIEDRINSERFDFEREDFFSTGTGGPGERGDVIQWENEYLNLLARIKELHGLTLDSVQKTENPPGSPQETPVIDLTQDWFLSPDCRDDSESAEKQETDAGTWIPYQGPDGGEGWQNVDDREDVRYNLDEAPGQVAEGYDADHWENGNREADTGLDVEGVREVFGNIHGGMFGEGESNEYRNVNHASIGLISEGRADSETVTEAILADENTIDADDWSVSGIMKCESLGEFIKEDSSVGDIPLVTNNINWPRQDAIEEFEEEIAWADWVPKEVDRGLTGWQLGMFTEECAPIFQLASDITGNDTLPEGGAYGDDDMIPSVLEEPVTYEDKEPHKAKMEQTQEILREAFGNTMTVYRGMNPSQGNPTNADPSDAPSKLIQAKDQGETVSHEHRPVESWTTNPSYASKYANGQAQANRSQEGVMLRKEVPIERVFASSHVSSLSEGESEVVVMHDAEEEYSGENIISSETIDNEFLIQEMLNQVSTDDSTEKQDSEESATIHISAGSIDPKWLHRDPPFEPTNDTVSKDVNNVMGDWVPYQGPRGGEGWQRVSDEEVVYQDDPPGDVAEGYESNFWDEFSEDEQQPTGYYNEDKWSEALGEPGLHAPSDIPTGTDIHYVSDTGNHHEGVVVGYDYGEQGESPAYLEITSPDGFEAAVTAEQIEGVGSFPHEESRGEPGEPIDFDWDTDVPRVDEIPDNTDVLYEGENGVRRVGQFARPTLVQTDEGTFSGMMMEDGSEVRLENIVAVDEGQVPLVPRDDPFEFESVLREEDMRSMSPWVRENVEPWGPKLAFTPFDDLGEVPLGAEVEFTSNKVNGTVTGEVTGYVDFDAEIGETNSLRVESNDDYVGETTIGPTSFERFVGPEEQTDLEMEEYLENPFNHAVTQQNSRQAGISGGNTTGEDMDILEMPDESRVFATPLKSYDNITTGIVDSRYEARRNNLNSPIMIEHLGGNGCATRVVEDQYGDEYIAKEGIPGDNLKDRSYDMHEIDDSDLIDSLEMAYATAHFVGNTDLHGGNVRVNFDTQEATIIDHDAAGGTSYGDGFQPVPWNTSKSGPADRNNVIRKVNDITRDYLEGDLSVPEELEGTEHESHFNEARMQVVEDQDNEDLWFRYNSTIHEPPNDTFSEAEDYAEGMEIQIYHTQTGRVKTATLTDSVPEDNGVPLTWYGETDDGYEVSFKDTDRVLEVLDANGHDPTTGDVEVSEENEAFMDALTDAGDENEDEQPVEDLSDLSPGQEITINEGSLFGDEEVVVDEIDNSGAVQQVFVRPQSGGDVFQINDPNAVVAVEEGDSQ